MAHGFYFPEPSVHIYGVSEYWDLNDELGCHFLASELNLDWPDKNPNISERDSALGSYQDLLNNFYKM